MLRPYFVGSFPRADVPLDPPLPELALIGRSNVGKSSLLNALVGQRIARVSQTPGKTRALNVYHIHLGRGTWDVGRHGESESGPNAPRPTPHALYFLDLPGYGYAKASKTDRAAFHRLLAGCLERPRLAGVVWLLDIRRVPSEDDGAMQDLLAARQTRVLAALTKSDKVPRGERRRRERTLAATLRLDEDQAVVTSARTGEGVTELREAIVGLVGSTSA
jgi:GTP-binding protein